MHGQHEGAAADAAASRSPDLSIITTVDLSRRPAQLLARLRHLSTVASAAGYRLVIAHNRRDSRHDAQLRRWHAQSGSGTTLVSERFYPGEVNNAVLRNAALAMVATPVSLLMDVDIFPDADLIAHLGRDIAQGSALAMAPCVYLTRTGTVYLRGGGTPSALVDDYFSFRRRYVLHVAVPSSVIAFRTADAREIGGFDETYAGHGYEDFDFILRLALRHGVLTPSDDLLVDRTYRAPLLAEGFRARLAALCLPRMIDKRFSFHLYHPRDNNDAYYRMRSPNQARFRERVQECIGTDRVDVQPCAPPLIETFFAQCAEKNRNPDDYLALFDARPPHMMRGGRLAKLFERLTRHLPC